MSTPTSQPIRRTLYPVAAHIRLACRILEISPAAVLMRAGLSSDHLETEAHGVGAAAYMTVFHAISELSPREDAALFLAREMAQQSYHAPIIAFASSHDIRTGLERMALFKPLAAPVRLRLLPEPGGLALAVDIAEPLTCRCPFLDGFELVFFLELCRRFTGEPLVPLAARLPQKPARPDLFETYLGCPLAPGETATLVLRSEDAARPLLTENAELWRGVEPELRRQLRDRLEAASLSGRVQAALADLLPAGKANADDVCVALGISRRSLQRRLRDEGKSFRGLLDATRERLAMDYLTRDMSAAEVSYLLAYRDPNSFYRAFQGWTGMTPGMVRPRRAG